MEGTSGILARGDSVKSGVASGAGADAVSAASESLLGDSPTKALSESGHAEPNADASPSPPPPPGAPPSDAVLSVKRDASMLRMRREMSCPTFFPELAPTPAPPASHPPMPPPAVTPTHKLGLCERSAPPRDIFAGDLDSIWKHLEFGRLYHHLAIQKRFVQMQSAGAAGARRLGGRGGRGGARAAAAESDEDTFARSHGGGRTPRADRPGRALRTRSDPTRARAPTRTRRNRRPER